MFNGSNNIITCTLLLSLAQYAELLHSIWIHQFEVSTLGDPKIYNFPNLRNKHQILLTIKFLFKIFDSWSIITFFDKIFVSPSLFPFVVGLPLYIVTYKQTNKKCRNL